MFLKITKGCLTASMLFCSAALCAQAPGTDDEVKRNVTVEEVLHDERYSAAEKFAADAGKDFTEGKYESSIANNLKAWKIYESIGKSAFLDGKILNCRKQIAAGYRCWADDLADEAEKLSRSEQYDEAIKKAGEAVAMSPSLKGEIDKSIARYKTEKKGVESRNKVTEAKVVPDQAGVDARIETLLAQAANLYRNGRVVEAKAKYNEVITIDRTNWTALRGVRACNIALLRAGNVRAATDAERMEVEAAGGYTVPIRPIGDAESKQLTNAKPIAKQVSSADNGLLDRVGRIIVSEISLTGEQLPDALNIVMEEARNNDPSGQGANIVLIWPDGYKVDQYGTPYKGVSQLDTLMMQTQSTAAGRNNAGRQNNRNRTANAGMPQGAAGMPPEMAAMMGAGMPGMMPMGPGAMTGMPTGNYGLDNTAAEPETYPKIALNMSNVPLEEIIRRICNQAGLKYKVDNNAIVVAPKSVAIGDMEIKLFPLKREALLATNFSNPQQLMYFFASHGILFPNGSSIVYDWRNSRLIVNNTADNLAKIEELIQTQLNIKDVQVQIQAKFVEVTENDLKELGFQYSLERTLIDSTGAVSNTNGQLQFNKNDSIMRHVNNGSDRVFTYNGTSDGYKYGVSVFALDWTDSRDVLFAPRVTTLNGETAVIKMIRRVYFPDDWDESSQTTTQADYSNAIMYSYIGPVPNFDSEPTDIGIQMVVKPEVDLANRTITMRMTPQVRQFVGWTTYEYEQTGTAFPPDEHGETVKEVLREPIFSDRIIDTLVSTRDGGTVVLGGIIRDETTAIDDKVPVLGEIPLFGRFFQSKSTKSKKIHLLIFMTCTLVNPDGSPYFPDSLAFERTGKPVITEAL